MTCTVLGCNSEKQEGDSLFCNYCREEWTEHCKRNGISERTSVEPEIYKDLLKQFQEHYMEKVKQ